jgi:hypothetical protein
MSKYNILSEILKQEKRTLTAEMLPGQKAPRTRIACRKDLGCLMTNLDMNFTD